MMLFLHFQRASITKYISYQQERLPRQHVMEIIKEVATVGNINQDTFSHWKELMSEHNHIVERGERMLLLPYKATHLNWIKFRCLDIFMLKMQSRYLAKLLNDFSTFGERVLRLIEESPASLVWNIGGQIVVERAAWYRLCTQLMTFLHVLGVADPSSPLRPWPDHELLQAAATRARGVFGRFARADTTMPTVRALLSPANSRGGLAAAAAEACRRRARRWREDSEPSRRAAAAVNASDGRGEGGAACLAESDVAAGSGNSPHTVRAEHAHADIQGSASPSHGAIGAPWDDPRTAR
jgi:hypothetical protein